MAALDFTAWWDKLATLVLNMGDKIRQDTRGISNYVK